MDDEEDDDDEDEDNDLMMMKRPVTSFVAQKPNEEIMKEIRIERKQEQVKEDKKK